MPGKSEKASSLRKWWSAALLSSGAAVLALINVLSDALLVKAISGMLLLTCLPGYAAGCLMFRRGEFDVLGRLFVGVAFSVALNCIGFLAIYYTGLRITPISFLSLAVAFVWMFSGISLFKSSPEPAPRRTARSLVLPLLILAIAGFFRFAHLGYSEYQGDEAGNVLSTSLRVVSGERLVLETDKRPPVQIIITALSYVLSASYEEWVIRFPFAMAGLVSVWLILMLGREMFGVRAGNAAGFLAAINGYLVMFSRIVQYQSVLVLSMLMSMLFFWRFMQAEEHREIRKYLLLGSAMCGFATITHYEGFLFLPVAVYAVARKFGRSALKTNRNLVLCAFAVFLSVSLTFYLPFLAQPQTPDTFSGYLNKKYSGFLSFNARVLIVSGGLYNSPVYLTSLALLAAVSLFRIRTNAGRITLAWFLSYFVFYMVICRVPNTHIYTFFPPWILMAGLGFQFLWEEANSVPANTRFAVVNKRGGALLIGVLCVGIFTGYYLYSHFIKHDPEYLWHRASETLPHFGFFGFPYHRGWKTVGFLFRTKRYAGEYASNEKEKITSFYLRQAISSSRSPRYILHTRDPQSWRKKADLGEGYALVARIFSGGRPAIDIYEKGGSPGEVEILHAENNDNRYQELDRRLHASLYSR